MTFEDWRKTSEIKEIFGKWFDLKWQSAEIQDQAKDDKVFKKMLSEAVIHCDYFAALMGRITFSRA